jgi:uncharacterized integral membrane protein
MARGTDQPKGEDRDVYRGSGFYLGLFVILLAAFLVLAFSVQNAGDVAVEILFLDFRAPLFAVALGAGLLAVLLDEVVGLVWRRRRRRRLTERSELRQLRAERADASASSSDEAETEGEAGEKPGTG